VPAARLDTARQQAGRARGDDDAGGGDAIDISEQRSFQCLVLRTALLHEVGVPDRTVEVACEREASSGRAPGQPNARERGPGVGDRGAQPGFRPRRGIPGDDVEPFGERPRGPAAADDAGADNGEPQTPLCFPPPLAGEVRVGVSHDTAAGRAVFRRSLVRASAGVSARAPSSSMIWIAFSTSWPLLANTPFFR